MHIVHWNAALAMFFALTFYLLTIPAVGERVCNKL
jgi:hypothetical protein